MTSPIAALSNEQKRQSDEQSEMRKMHMELMRSVAELCGRLDVIKAQYDSAAQVQTAMQSDLKMVTSKVDGLMIEQASNKFTLDLVRKINNYVIITAVGSIGSIGAVASMFFKGHSQ